MNQSGPCELIQCRAASVFGSFHPPKISAATQQFDELELLELLEEEDDELDEELLEDEELELRELEELELLDEDDELDDKLLDEELDREELLDDDESAFSALACHAQHSELELEEELEEGIMNTPLLAP